MSIYTKTGDKGETSFINGERVRKNDLRIEVYGTLDELNSLLGVTMHFIEEAYLKEILSSIQNDLFTLTASLAALHNHNTHSHTKYPKIAPKHIREMETRIDEFEGKLSEQKCFLLPGGTQSASFLHLSRTVARRSERLLVSLSEVYPVSGDIMKYINRLSDLLYVLARYSNEKLQVKEQQPIYKYFEETETEEGKEITTNSN